MIRLQPTIFHVSLVIALTAISGLFHITERGPVADEEFYLNFAYTLYKDNVFGKTAAPGLPAEPAANVAPILPFFVSVLMRADKELANTVECNLFSNGEKCEGSFNTIKYAELALLAICLGIVWLLLYRMSDSLLLSYLTILIVLISGSPYFYIDHFLTESIYFPMACIFALVFAKALANKEAYMLAIASVLIGMLALTRPTFFYLFFILLAFSLLYIFILYRRIALSHKVTLIFSFIIPFALVVSPWLARNYYNFDRPSITLGYGDKALSSRLAHNKMTDKEYLYGWIYWLPDFGDSLARDLFGKDAIKRFDHNNPYSFLLHERSLLLAEVQENINRSKSVSNFQGTASPERWLINRYIIGDLYNHIKVTMLMAWRGVFVEKYFGLFGLLFLLWGLTNGLKQHVGPHFFLISLPPLILLFFHAAISFSIPRYNILLILPMSIAMSAAFCSLYQHLTKIRMQPSER